MERFKIYTDGGCSPNPGPGGWGVVIVGASGAGERRELSGHELTTTNNRMELTAAVEGLRALPNPSRVTLITDSQYVKNGITHWFERWKAKGWVTTGKKPVKNRDLWEELDQEQQRHEVEWRWTKGHAGNVGNERADQLATSATPKSPLPTDDASAVHLFLAISFSPKTKSGCHGIVLRYQEHRREVSGVVDAESSNQLHIRAAVAGLECLKRRSRVHVYTGSGYLRDGATRWIPAWRARGWLTTEKQPVSHQDLWMRLDALQSLHEVTWHVIDRKAAGAPEEIVAAKNLSIAASRVINEESHGEK